MGRSDNKYALERSLSTQVAQGEQFLAAHPEFWDRSRYLPGNQIDGEAWQDFNEIARLMNSTIKDLMRLGGAMPKLLVRSRRFFEAHELASATPIKHGFHTDFQVLAAGAFKPVVGGLKDNVNLHGFVAGRSVLALRNFGRNPGINSRSSMADIEKPAPVQEISRVTVHDLIHVLFKVNMHSSGALPADFGWVMEGDTLGDLKAKSKLDARGESAAKNLVGGFVRRQFTAAEEARLAVESNPELARLIRSTGIRCLTLMREVGGFNGLGRGRLPSFFDGAENEVEFGDLVGGNPEELRVSIHDQLVKAASSLVESIMRERSHIRHAKQTLDGGLIRGGRNGLNPSVLYN